MIEQIEGTNKGVIGMKAIGQVTDHDYKTVLIPCLESAIQNEGKVRFLFEFADNFEGYDLEAIWDDAQFGFKHCKDFERIAVVGAPLWVRVATRLFSGFMPAQVKCFNTQQLQQAYGWLAA